mmetsp:Transcript_23357/g.30498  ORF Transcript_23357/g.30498 Transcript_23357/m.30498 type:complete len:309 (+) Transcript_23357:224-1150(+)
MKAESLKLGAFLFLWYVFNIGYNIYNKKVLLAFPFPWTVACLQLGIGLLYILPVWSLNIRPAPSLTFEDIKKIGPVAAFHTMGHVATVCALGGGSVGFVHIIKAAEPFFSTILTAFFTGAFQPFLVNLALVPVVGGVCIASVSELSFTWPTFLSAMSSNSFFSMRAIFSKKAMTKEMKEQKNLDAANLYAALTLISFLGLLPFALAMEGRLLTVAYNRVISEIGVATFYKHNMLAGMTYYLYNEVAYLVLGEVTPVTHAVANTIKRIVILLASVLVFGTAMTTNGIIGSTVAIGGVLFYSLMKNRYSK